MVHKTLLISLVLFGIAFSGTTSLSADTNLTPQQLVLLMKASREQYESIDAAIEAKAYQYDDDKKTNPKLKATQKIISRWRKDKSFSRIVRTSYPDKIPHKGYTPTIISTYAISPKLSKRLIEAPDNRIPRAIIRSDRLFEENPTFCSVHGAMWNLGYKWELMNLGEATVTHDKENGYYVMRVDIGGGQKRPIFILHIDPSKDYIPVKREFLKPDGTLLSTFRCDDFHQTENGLWVPHSYSWFDPIVNYGEEYKVEKVVVNEPIADNLLDFDFPQRTIVTDERLKLRYRIQEKPLQRDAVDPCSATIVGAETEKGMAAKPAKDRELLGSALKTKELLQTNAVKEIAKPVTKVSPAIVLVTAENAEYKLSVKKTDIAKPILLNHSFQSDELQLLSFKNIIDNQNQLIINVNRPQSLTSFAKGILILQFAGEEETVKITFVSPPLSDAP